MSEPSLPSRAERRIPGLDGLRGLASLMVVLSHYFGEVAHGVRALMMGWIAVDIFFVLSGFLIGRLVLDKCRHANFFMVFYARRFWRIIPPYLVALGAIGLLVEVCPAGWADASIRFPEWVYAAFLQGLWMTGHLSIGTHWLAPTWTLAVEEHFYLIAPAVLVFAPRRALPWLLGGAALCAIALRAAAVATGPHAMMAGLTLLPGRMDLLICGILAAIALRSAAIPWERLMPLLRLAPLLALVAAIALAATGETILYILGPAIVGLGCAAFILCIVLGAPEARRLDSRLLRFFGDNAYCLYLTHLPVLGLMHGLILGSAPDLQRPAQWLVTLAALPVCVAVGRAMTKLIEEPLTAFGRRWTWSAAVMPHAPAAPPGLRPAPLPSAR